MAGSNSGDGGRNTRLVASLIVRATLTSALDAFACFPLGEQRLALALFLLIWPRAHTHRAKNRPGVFAPPPC